MDRTDIRAAVKNKFVARLQPNPLAAKKAPGKTVLFSAHEPAAKGAIKLYSKEYYAACGIGGILSCGLTHTLVTPLDLVKCNAQANPKEFPGTIGGFKTIYSGAGVKFGFGSGFSGLMKGWGPTFVGYSIQGLCKFGFYEYFKHEFSMIVGEEQATKHRSLVFAVASASAEVIADVAFCPFEAVKVRIQTTPNFARGLLDGLPKMASEGVGNLYAGLGPLWARQVPYTVIKFVAFERIAEKIYSMLPKPKSEMSSVEQMGVVFTAGYIAGVLCGAVSHPADTMVSKINKLKMDGGLGKKMSVIYYGTPESPGIGFAGLWKGFTPRVIMIGTLTGLQWFIYGAFKAAVGLPTPGASPAPVK
jgi:solute carrier family 25 phosphate transporter 3